MTSCLRWGDDFVNDIDEAVLKNFAKRGIREFGFDIMNRVKSLKLSVNSANDTVELPDDYVDMVKIGVVGSDGVVYVLGENKNINISQKYKTDSNDNPIDSDNDGVYDRVDSKGGTAGSNNSTSNVGDGFEDYVFRNYVYGGVEGRLYGVGGGQYEEDTELTLIRTESRCSRATTSLRLSSSTSQTRLDPQIQAYISTLRRLSRSYVYFKIIERKAAVPIAEKQRARQEYYNERRKANARMKAFSKEEALKTIRKNYKQAPKG